MDDQVITHTFGINNLDSRNFMKIYFRVDLKRINFRFTLNPYYYLRLKG